MYFAEYWDDQEGEYVSFASNDRMAIRDWCFENQVPYFTDLDDNEYSV